MFEGAIAAFLNRLLGKYIEDLDIEQFNIGIFSGDTCLTDLKLKPEALYQLGLPIKVEIGLIGKIILKIPWSGLFSQPIILCIEDIYIVTVPIAYGPYDAEIQKRLIRAEKKKILEDLKEDETFKTELFDHLLASVTKNFQITINNVHIRYEEKLNGSLCACGICIQSISVMTTNSKWKPGVCTNNLSTIYQLIRAESLSIYMDHDTESSFTNIKHDWNISNFLAWKNTMHRALQTFGMRNKEFQFLLKPFTAKIKVIIHKGNETQTSRMLVDIVLHDVAMQISKMQYVIFCHLYDSLLRAIINKPYIKYRPNEIVRENPSAWWKYAYNSILDYNIRPYTWTKIIEHRKNYRKYKEICLQSLLRPNDTELKLDLQKYEDYLTILNMVIAREHAKQELKNKTIEEKHQNVNTNISIQKLVQNTSMIKEIQNNDMQNSLHHNSERQIKLEKLPQPIDYKFNFTLANCCLSLLNHDKEILVISITQLLTSIEIRSVMSAFKVSARAESFVIEGVSTDGDLVPLIMVDNVLTGNVSTNFLAVDFEKNGETMDPTFDVSIKLEAIEITYHHHAMIEIIQFFKFNDSYIQMTILWAYKLYDNIKRNFLILVDNIVSQTLRIRFKIDIKGPYIVFPEYGSIQKGGNILVMDFGNINLSNELQATNLQLEDATLMELEELLYDRIHIEFSGAQILFCHSGDDWRSARKKKDSEYHFLPKIQATTTISCSIKPEYYQLPRIKINVSISSVKFNLSENKIQLIIYFLNVLLLAYQQNIQKYKINLKQYISKKNLKNKIFISTEELKNVQRNICLSSIEMMENKFTHVTKDLLTNHVQKLDRSIVSSEISEEDLELLSKTISLSGFDDNVSPYNHINLLLRFAIGELSIHLGIIHYRKEEPYLNLRLHTLYFEIAIMEYGPAIQFGIGSILLIDKTNVGITGSYLELISTEEPHEVFIVSYRKVKSNCPDFKSHFKSIERSLVINILNININVHRPALLKIREYWYNLINIFENDNLFNFIENTCYKIIQWKIIKEDDPPIPPGAIKLNYSARFSALVIRFCDKDLDLIKMQILGLENDCIYNANERMILRAYLRHLSIEDLNEDTLYSKILTTEEDKVFDFKYVRHIPRLYTYSDIDMKQDDVMSDGIFKLSIGRMNCVLICKILYDLKYFLAPFFPIYCLQFKKYLVKKIINGIDEFKRSATKLHIFIDIQGPIFLLPQRKEIPSLLVLNTGILSVENFFKKIDQSIQNKVFSNDTNQLIIDNILIKLNNITVSRAIMTLSHDLEIQEPIVEPVHIHFDIKRKTEYRSAMEFQTYGLFNIQGSMDFIYINLSQKDLKSSILVWKDNVSKIILLKDAYYNETQSTTIDQVKKVSNEDAMVKKLEDFLTHNENSICEINTNLSLEGLQLNLFLDSEEVLSSPVRDLNHGLCRLTFGEIINTCAFYSDRSLKMKLSLQSCLLQDTRKESESLRKIIQSPARQIGMQSESCISISMSPIVDIMYTRAPAGEKCFDALIQEVRINLSVPFVMHLTRYIMDCFPGDQIEEGIINHGYENNNSTINKDIITAEKKKLKHVQYFTEEPDASVSVRIHKPEILFFGDFKANNAHIILLQAEISIESSRHSCSTSIVYTFTDVRAKSKKQGNYSHHIYWLLCPCDIEICRKEEAPDFNINYTIAVNKIDIHLSAEIIHTFINILNETTSFIDNINMKLEDRFVNQDFNIHTNLWTPKKISNVPYKKLYDNNSHLIYEYRDRIVTFNLKPLMLYLLLEIEYSMGRFPVIKIESIITISINDWFNDFTLESNAKIYAFCYNMDYKNWEPLIDLCSEDDMTYKSWELMIKMYHGEAFMINSNSTDLYQHIKQNTLKIKKKSFRNIDQDITDMIFITPDHLNITKTSEAELYSTYEDSDTDDEERQKNLIRTSNYLFNSNSSGDEDSDSNNSSTNEDEGLELTPECNIDSFGQLGHEPIKSNDMAVYIIISAEDKFNIVITPNLITIIDIIMNAFQQATSGIPLVPINMKQLNLQNAIGHESYIEYLVSEENNKNITRIIASENYHDISPSTSIPSSPELETHSDLVSPKLVDSEMDFIDPDINLQNHSMPIQDIFEEDSSINIYKKITGEVLRIIFKGFEDVLVYCPKKQGCNLIPLRPIRHEVRYHLIIEANINNYLYRTITVRSPLLFRNETSYALGLYYKKSLLDKLGLTCIGKPTNPFDDNIRMSIIEPDSTYSIPLYIAYHFPIHILPAYLEKYQVSEEGIYWKELSATNLVKDICCKMKEDENNSIFYVKVSCNEIPVITRPSCQVPNYLISICSPFIFNNRLPFVIDVHIPAINYEVKIEPGEKINIHSLNCNIDIQLIFKIQNYLAVYWIGMIKLNTNLEKKFVVMNTDSELESTKPFLLCVELCKITSWHIIIQSQYWMINKSGLSLFIQECHSHIINEIPEEELMVFSQKNNKKSMVRLKAHQSEWSLPFGLEGITSMSLIVCKDIERGRKYKILTEVESSRLSPNFTKIITFLPYFYINNKMKRTLRFMEENDQADLWNDLLPGQNIPFWPVTESMKMRIKWRNSQLVSQHFSITHTGKTVLRMDNGSAVTIEIKGGINSPYYITFQKYVAGDIPVRIDNFCDDLFLKISQYNLGQVVLINPFQSLLYTWDDPTKTRELIWNVYNNKKNGYSAKFEKDGYGQEIVPLLIINNCNDGISSTSSIKSQNNKLVCLETTSEDFNNENNNYNDDCAKSSILKYAQANKTVVYWVSYMEGNQRILLFTQEETVFLKAKSIIDPEPSKKEIFVSFAGIGVSIIKKSNEILKELMYANITDSAAHWELYFNKKWKNLSLELSAWIESKYINSCKKAKLENFIDVDLVKMHMTKPFFGRLRRTYSPGIWLHCRKSMSLTYLQGYIHRIQVDNQIRNTTIPVILHSNLQKNIINYAGYHRLKHCVEFTCLKQKKINYNIYKSICVIIREFNLNLQEGFLLSLIDLIPKRPETKYSIAAKLRKDVSSIHFLPSNKTNNNIIKRKNIIEHIFISPILIRLILLADAENPNIYNINDIADYKNIIRFIFEYSEKGGSEKHAEFRLSCYQRNLITIDTDELLLDLSRSYIIQIMQQFHVLIRSTTVLGNQYGYNFKSSRDNFYESNMLILCREEIAEKLSYEVACQLGYTTLDTTQIVFDFNNVIRIKEPCIQNKDIPPLNPSMHTSFSTEIEFESYSLVTAFMNSIHQEELKYFFKTLAKKTLIFFNTESSLKTHSKIITDIIKRAQEIGYKFISRIRLPRYINPYKGVEIFSMHKAKGMHLLSIINKNPGIETDTYWAHTTLSNDGKYIALVSLQRLYFIEKGCTWGSLNVKWTLETHQLLSPPTIVNNRLILHVNKNEDTLSPIADWYLESEAKDILEWLCRKINIAMILNMENSICSKQVV